MRWRTARQSTFVIHTGRGMLDNLNAVLDGTVDIAFTTPGVNATMVLQGLGPYTGPHPELRALAEGRRVLLSRISSVSREFARC